jgi:hypothetical protein
MPQITITPATERAGKLADADLVFTPDDGAILAGLRLTGFSIWRSRYDGAPRVLPPSRQYWKDGEKRTYGLLRDAAGTLQQDHPLIAVILREYDRATRPAPRPAPVTEAAARASWDAAIAASRPQAQPPAIAPALDPAPASWPDDDIPTDAAPAAWEPAMPYNPPPADPAPLPVDPPALRPTPPTVLPFARRYSAPRPTTRPTTTTTTRPTTTPGGTLIRF